MALVQLSYNLQSDFRGHSISRHKSGTKRGMMGVVTQDRTVIWPTSFLPVPSGNPRIFEVHALEYKMWTEECHLKRICPIFFSLGVYAATEEHLKERGTWTSLKVM
jgi:hypothetical protein